MVKKLVVILVFFTVEISGVPNVDPGNPPYYSAYMDAAGYKWVANRTGWPILFTIRPEQREPFTRYAQNFTHQMPANAIHRLKYPGKRITGFGWQTIGSTQAYNYLANDAVTNANLIIVKPNGQVEIT